MQSTAQECNREEEIPPQEDKDDEVGDKKIEWGARLAANSFKSVSIRGEVYYINDCVRLRSKRKPDHVGKIMKLMQIDNKKFCKIRWFFQSSELPELLIKRLGPSANVKELFLASGKKEGVENDNPLMTISSKCRVLCTADHEFNEKPSRGQIQAADYYFYRAFDCDRLKVVGLDGLVDDIGAQKVFNKKDWLVDKSAGYSSSQILDSRLQCHSSGSGSLQTNRDAKGMPPLPLKILPPHKLEESGKMKLGKRPRGDLDELLIQRGISEGRKSSSFPISKKPKLLVGGSVSVREQDPKNTELLLETRRKMLQSSDAPPQSKGKQVSPGIRKRISPAGRLEVGTKGWNSGSTKSPGSSVPASQPKQLTKGRELSAAHNSNTRVSPAGGGDTRNIVLKPVNRSVNSTERENLNTTEKGKMLEYRQFRGPSISSKKNAMGSKITSEEKVPLTKNPFLDRDKCQSAGNPSTTKNLGKVDHNSSFRRAKEMAKHRLDKSLPSSGPRGMDKPRTQGTIFKSKQQALVTLDSRNATTSENVTYANMVGMANSGMVLEAREDAQEAPRGQLFKPKLELWEDSIERAIKARRVLRLQNVDLTIHSADLEDHLTEFLKTRCEVRKAPPMSFYYNSAEALVKLPSAKRAEEILKTMEENCLVLGDRPVIASLFELTEYLKDNAKFLGHLHIQQKQREEYKNAVATSHAAQGNTIEFTFGIPWRLLQEQQDLQWQLLRKVQEDDMKTLQEAFADKTEKPYDERN